MQVSAVRAGLGAMVIASVACSASAPSTSSPAAAAPAASELASWNDGEAKRAIVDFVNKTTTAGSPTFVPPAERIAVFDNDGTLWSEQPMYVQLAFALDRVKALAPSHPEWQTQEPFASVLNGDLKGVMAGGEHALVALMMSTHAGTTTEEFGGIVSDWVAEARHPKTGRRYTEMVYQPMLELLGYLRANGYKTFIVSGGGVEFMRPWAEQVYGIPPEQVIGSSIRTTFESRSGEPVLVRLPELNFIDDGPGKPVGIQQHIGRRPIMAFGNSDGDLQMLQWTTTGPGARFGLLVRHTDGEREFAYDRASKIGHLEKALDSAATAGWIVVDMKRDWSVIHPPAK
jgi:phosphoglycolate phosphatase-like HAD superfamily hydrolase